MKSPPHENRFRTIYGTFERIAKKWIFEPRFWKQKYKFLRLPQRPRNCSSNAFRTEVRFLYCLFFRGWFGYRYVALEKSIFGGFGCSQAPRKVHLIPKIKLTWVPGTWNILRASKILFYKSTCSQFSNDASELSLRLWVGTHGQNRKNSVNVLKKSHFLVVFHWSSQIFWQNM